MEGYYLLTFENTHNAINAESVLKNKAIRNTVMPTPTSITKSCGICLKIDNEQIENVKNLIKENSIKVKAMFYREGSSFQNIEL